MSAFEVINVLDIVDMIVDFEEIPLNGRTVKLRNEIRYKDIDAAVLFSAIVIGAQATAISPFSSGGSLVLSTVSEEERVDMFGKLIFRGVPICLGAAIIYAFIVNLIM